MSVPAATARRRDAIIAFALCVLTVSWMLGVEGRQGVGRDEAQYFRAAERYWGWFETLGRNFKTGHLKDSFSRAGIDTYWEDNHEHPVIMKTLFAFSWRLFHRCQCEKQAPYHYLPVHHHTTLPLFTRESTAFRFPAILMAGLGAALVFWFGRRFVGTGPATAAAVMSVAQPHYFFHAQIAAFDVPITVMAVAVGFCYWKSLRAPRWAILGGLAFGVALGVKHNAWLMPFFLIAHYLWIRRGDLLGWSVQPADGAPRPGFFRRLRLPPIPLVFVAMLVLGPLVFFAHWPKLWVDPIGHTRWYLNRHLQHEHYNFEYLGRNWNNPPQEWDRKLLRMTFPFVSAAFTVPATTLVLFAVGATLLARRALRRRRGQADDSLLPQPPPAGTATWLRPGADVDLAPGIFFAVQILGPMAAIAMPSTPIFGGVKHFLPAMPYLSIVAGVGVRWLVGTVRAIVPREGLRRAAPAGLAALVCLPALVETRRSHPDGLSHYNFFAGGFAGGASLGMNRQFWGYSVMPMLGWIEGHAPSSRQIYWHDVIPDALNIYVRDGRLHPGLGNVGVGEDVVKNSDLGIVIHERHFLLYDALFWESYGSTRPAYVRTREGVPLVSAYRRADLPPAPRPAAPGAKP